MDAATIPEDRTSADAAVWTTELVARVDEWARAAGFDLAGVAAAGGEGETADARRFARWVEAGRAGEMEYLKRRDASGELVRTGLQKSLPWARSVVVCAMSYRSEGPRSVDGAPEGTGWIARYAWSGRRPVQAGCGPVALNEQEARLVPTDYHDEMLGRLRRVETQLNAETGCTTRCYVDTGPLLERGLAARAGIGWIGRNTCVLNEELGSWLLLGVIVTSLDDTRRASLVSADRCGSCTQCIDACPTDALLGGGEPGSAREMDASRCIAYLTIEKKGTIAEELRVGMGRQVFGCDICQEVCPWNAKAARGGPAEVREGMQPRLELVNPALEWLAEIGPGEFKRMFKGSPLERTGRKRLQRNVAIAMGNSGEEKFLPQLERWADASGEPAGDGPANQNDGALREAAVWARDRISTRSPSD